MIIQMIILATFFPIFLYAINKIFLLLNLEKKTLISNLLIQVQRVCLGMHLYWKIASISSDGQMRFDST